MMVKTSLLSLLWLLSQDKFITGKFPLKTGESGETGESSESGELDKTGESAETGESCPLHSLSFFGWIVL